MRGAFVVFAIIVAAPGVPGASAQDIDADLGRNLAATCANCHGTNGVAASGAARLAGQAGSDIARKMQDFKSGRRPGTIMPQLAKGYTDEQIDALSRWFALRKAPQ